MGSKVKTPKSSSFHLLSVHHWLCLYLYQINIHCLLGGSTVAVVFPCIPIFLGVRFWWSNYVNDHILLQSPNIIYTFTVFIYLCIYLNLAGILMATVLLNEIPISPYLPSLLEQCQQLVGTSQKTWLVDGNFHYKPQNHHVKCMFFLHKKNKLKEQKNNKQHHPSISLFLTLGFVYIRLSPMIWSWPGHRLPSSGKGEPPRPGGCNA